MRKALIGTAATAFTLLASPCFAEATAPEQPSRGVPLVIASELASQPPLILAADPACRDALFGTSAAPANDAAPPSGSRDALFGAEPAAPRVRLSGFLNGLAGYTYADPEHWSRAVARLQLTAQGDLGGGVKWKLSGRVDTDPVYYNSGFYPDPVKHDQRIDFFYRENYLDFSAADWDFRVGAQHIVWGEVIGLFFADVVSARDMREFLLPGFDIIRIPQGAVRAERTWGDNHVELIWIPVPAFDKIGKPGAEFYPVPLPSPVSENVANLFRDPQRPSHDLSNSNYGIRANTLLAGWDVAGFYYRSFSTSPTFYRVPGDSPEQPFVFEPRYDRISQVGGTFSKDLGEVVLRGEGVYTTGQHFALSDLTATPGDVERRTLDAIVSAEWNFGDTRVNVQAFNRHFFGGGAGGIAVANDGFGATLYLSHKMGNVEPQILLIRNFSEGDSLIRPRVNWTVARNVTVGVGADIFNGPSDTYFGRFSNRDRAFAEVRFDF